MKKAFTAAVIAASLATVTTAASADSYTNKCTDNYGESSLSVTFDNAQNVVTLEGKIQLNAGDTYQLDDQFEQAPGGAIYKMDMVVGPDPQLMPPATLPPVPAGPVEHDMKAEFLIPSGKNKLEIYVRSQDGTEMNKITCALGPKAP